MPRTVVVGYFEDGRDLATMAMNGWGAAEPAWWLNLQDHPDAIVQTRDGVKPVRARRAQGVERDRLWARWAEIDKHLDNLAARRPTETAVVILEPRDAAEPRSSPVPAERIGENGGGPSRPGASGAGKDTLINAPDAMGPGRVASAAADWWVPALAGAAAFWLANLLISMTSIAAAYRSALSIRYVPMLLEAAAGGLILAGAVAFLLTRFPGRIPGGGPLRKALTLALIAVVLVTVLLELPAKLSSDVADSGYWLLMATVINTIRTLALGLSIGLVVRARTTRRGRPRVGTRREAQS